MTNEADQVRSAYRSGGGWVTDLLHGHLGDFPAIFAVRKGASPSQVSVVGMLVSILGTVPLVVNSRSWICLVVASISWNLAYVLDCADGQVARVTGKASAAGARVDLMGDYIAHAASLVGVIVVFGRGGRVGVGWLAAFAITWMLGVFLSALYSGSGVTSAFATIGVSSSSLNPLRTVFRQCVDYGAQLVVVSFAVLLVGRGVGLVLFGFLLLVNSILGLLHPLQILRSAGLMVTRP